MWLWVWILLALSAVNSFEEPKVDMDLYRGILSLQSNRDIIRECIVDKSYGDENGMYNWYSASDDDMIGNGLAFGFICNNWRTVLFYAYEWSNGWMDYINSSHVLGDDSWELVYE